MIRQTIRTFYEVKDGVVKVLGTTSVYMRKRKEGCRDAEGSIKPRTEKGLHGI